MDLQKLSRSFLFRAASLPQLRACVPRQRSSSYACASKLPSFPVLESTFESWSKSDQARRNLEQNLGLFSEVISTRAAILSKEDGVRVQDRSSRKLTVQERINLLKDEGSEVLDIGLFAGLNMPYGRVNNANNSVSIVKIAGETCVVSANVWTFKGGTLYPISVKKQLRAQEIAMENRLPCIYLVDSGGAFLPLQVRFIQNYYVDQSLGINFLCRLKFSLTDIMVEGFLEIKQSCRPWGYPR